MADKGTWLVSIGKGDGTTHYGVAFKPEGHVFRIPKWFYDWRMRRNGR